MKTNITKAIFSSCALLFTLIIVVSVFLPSAFALRIPTQITRTSTPNDGYSPSALQSNWTIIVYMDGDNDLEICAIDDFNEMEAAPSSAAVNVVLQFDRYPGYDSSNGNWNTTRRYLVSHDNNSTTINSTMIADLGELNMGSPATLVDFVRWAIQDYPAEHYMLVLWDHGSGWRATESSLQKSVCTDYSSGSDSLSLQELGNALSQINMSTGVKLDILGFDACYMAMLEVDYQIHQYADYRVGSEEIEPGDGWNYQATLTALANNPSMTPSELASRIIDDYFIPYGIYGEETMSATNLNQITSVTTALDAFTQRLSLDVSNASYWTEIVSCRDNTQEYDDNEFADLYSFAARINGSLNIVAETKTAANALLTAISSYVIDEQHGSASSGSHGLSIYYPSVQDNYENQYDSLTFSNDTNWNEWLKGDFYEPDNTFAQAHGISVLASISSERHAINPEGDKDYYQFSVSSDSLGTYIFYTSGSTDTYGYLYNSGYAELARNDDYGDRNFRIEYNITTSGTYYVMVRGYSTSSTTGPYTIYYSRVIQHQVTFNYQVSGGGSGYSAPSVTYTSRGLLRIVTAGPMATVLVDFGSTYTYTPNPLTGSGSSERWYTLNDTSGNVTSSTTVSPLYYHQYHLSNNLIVGSVNSITPSPTSDSWYNNGSNVNVVLNYTWNIVASQSRNNLFSYTVDGLTTNVTRSGAGTCSLLPMLMTAAHTISDAGKTQYFLTVTGGNNVSYGTVSPTSDNWYDSGTLTTLSSNWVWNTNPGQNRTTLTNYAVDGVNKNPTRQTSGTITTAPIAMSTYHAVAFASATQYYLTLSSSYGSPTGQNWYDSGSTAYAGLGSGTVSGGAEVRYIFVNWGVDASGNNYAQSNSITMNSPKTAVANWQTQYQVPFASSPSSGGTTNPSGTNTWQNGGEAISVTAIAASGYSFSSWTTTGSITVNQLSSSSTTATVNGPGTVTANFAAASTGTTPTTPSPTVTTPPPTVTTPSPTVTTPPPIASTTNPPTSTTKPQPISQQPGVIVYAVALIGILAVAVVGVVMFKRHKTS